jgi:hypothetical protein
LLLRLAPLLLVAGLLAVLNLSGGGGHGSASLVGPEQTVFQWSRDACEPIDVPDAPARAFRDSSGKVELIAASYVNRRFTGPDLDHLRHPCNVVMPSQYDPNPAAFGDRSWIAAPYTKDGRTVFALVHDEYQGSTHAGKCPVAEYRPCWYNAITFAASRDAGRTFSQPPVPQRLVAGVPYPYQPGAGPYGLFQPSNIVLNPKDGYHYSLIRAEAHADQRQGVCAIRTQDVSNPGSWRAWDGHAFTVQLADPYASPPGLASAGHICAPVKGDVRGMTQSLTFNTYFGKFMLLGSSIADRGTGGFFFTLSDDLVHWSSARLVRRVELVYTYQCGDSNPLAHPSVIDPSSTSRNFETAGREPYLYFTRFHYQDCTQTLNRDLIRERIRFSK